MLDPSRHWPALLADVPELRERLLTAYDAPHRGYHDRRHLAEVLTHIEEIGAAEQRPSDDAVVLAAWFHDAVYEGARDDEERSALLARDELTAAGAPGALVDEVVRLVLLTASHHPQEDDTAGQVLCDADLAILAAGPERYRDYLAGVRHEYAALTEKEFRTGRAAVLRDLLEGPTLFHTDYGIQHWQDAAVHNIEQELQTRSVGDPDA